jgi:putative ribosome biogenesis GTPase RsgA
MKKLVIVFFLVCSNGLNLRAIELLQFILGEDSNGELVLRLNQTVISQKTGTRTLKRLANLNPEQTLLIVVGPEVSTQHLFDFLTSAQDAGLQNIDVIIKSKLTGEAPEQPQLKVLKLQRHSLSEQIVRKNFTEVEAR